MAWPPEHVEVDTGAWTVGDLREGDLVFGQKAGGALVQLCRLADEPWLHVGSVVSADGELKIIEIRGDRFLLSDLSFFFGPDRYVQWGAARLRVQPECWQAANDWMCSYIPGANGQSAANAEAGMQVYAWDDLVLAGVISATRRGLLAQYPAQVRSAIAVAGAYCKESLRYRGETSLTCSSFVQLAYDAAGGRCAIEHPRWRSESAWPPRTPGMDELFAMSAQELTEWSDASVVELYLRGLDVDRGASTTKPRPGQAAEGMKVLLAAVGGFAAALLDGTPSELPDGLGVDGRWVTPGDLWRSPSVSARGMITPPADWQ